MSARPDLEAIKAEAEELSFDSGPAGRMSGLLEEVIAYALQLEQDAAGARELVSAIEMHCPCGARPESPRTHPHVGGCPVATLKTLLGAAS